MAKIGRTLYLMLFPCVITFGPVLGLTTVLLAFKNGSVDALDHAAKLRKASTCVSHAGAYVGLNSQHAACSCPCAKMHGSKQKRT